MFRLLKCIKKKNDESGSAELIALLFSLILLISLCVVALDLSMFYQNRSTIQSVARDGARTVAILGGAGDKYHMSKLEKAYGTSEQLSTTIKKSLEENPALSNVIIKNVSCGPYRTDHVGDETYCSVTFQYYPLPGDPLSLLGDALAGEKTITGTAQSEVRTDPNDMIPRK